MVVDIVVGLVTLVSSIIAFLRGFIREVLTIFGVVSGLLAAYFGGGHLAVYMNQWLGVKEGEPIPELFGMIPYNIIADALSYGAIFITVVIILSILSHFLAETAKTLGLGAIDRTLGVVFGIARAVLLLGLVYLPFHFILEAETKAKWFEGSRTYIYIEKTAIQLSQLLPEDKQKEFEEEMQGLSETLNAKEKLQEIEVLQSDEPDSQLESDQQNKQGQGYDPEFRQKMDELFQRESTNEANE